MPAVFAAARTPCFASRGRHTATAWSLLTPATFACSRCLHSAGGPVAGPAHWIHRQRDRPRERQLQQRHSRRQLRQRRLHQPGRSLHQRGRPELHHIPCPHHTPQLHRWPVPQRVSKPGCLPVHMPVLAPPRACSCAALPGECVRLCLAVTCGTAAWALAESAPCRP